ncbi:hypothetical protein TNCV_1220181 [Trichonephila clavipes]|nr:hypothetical protein TNCV_1220181 [Trichonephila clavipes]
MDCVYVTPLPAKLPDLRQRIEAAVERITSDTLNKVWDELAYRLHLCRVTNGAHIEHLQACRLCPAVGDFFLWLKYRSRHLNVNQLKSHFLVCDRSIRTPSSNLLGKSLDYHSRLFTTSPFEEETVIFKLSLLYIIRVY